MARKIKIDNAILKRRAYKSQKRKVGKRLRRKNILIVCEGEKTEPNYFASLKKKLPIGTLDTFEIEIKGTGTSSLKIVEIAINLRTEAESINNKIYDQVWVVFDRDSFPAGDFNNAIFKADAKKINCAWSNEAFELWYVLHFQYRNTAMNREDYKKCIEIELQKAIQPSSKDFKFTYLKNSESMYDLLQKYGNEERAIQWAEKLDSTHVGDNMSNHNPSTKVYKLVRMLNELNLLR